MRQISPRHATSSAGTIADPSPLPPCHFLMTADSCLKPDNPLCVSEMVQEHPSEYWFQTANWEVMLQLDWLTPEFLLGTVWYFVVLFAYTSVPAWHCMIFCCVICLHQSSCLALYDILLCYLLTMPPWFCILHLFTGACSITRSRSFFCKFYISCVQKMLLFCFLGLLNSYAYVWLLCCIICAQWP
jgi:hypothetical protein